MTFAVDYVVNIGDLHFHSLLEAVPDAMVVVDSDGAIAFVNSHAEEMFGFTRSYLVGRPVEFLMPERFRTIHVHHRNSFGHEARVRPMGAGLRLFGLHQSGQEFPVEVSLSPVQTEAGSFVCAAIRDVTEQRRIEHELRQKNEAIESANEAKSRFLASMSHELRTPLNAIVGFTGTLLMKLPGPLTSEQEQQLAIIQSSARHLLSLINDMLDIEKIELGKLQVHPEPVVLATVLRDIHASLQSMAVEKGLTFEVDVPDEWLTLMTDRRSLQQILINLVNNAIKYTDAGSVRVSVATGQATGTVVITVSDTGIGVREEDLPRLFQAFEQLDSSSTRRFQGAGLGLFLSQRLALLLGARIECASKPGVGSTFALVFPPK